MAYYIVLEKEIAGLDKSMDGKSLSRNIEALDRAALEAGVQPLSAFFSMAAEDAAEFMAGEGMDLDGMELPVMQQFAAEDGLTTLTALAAHPVGQRAGVADDLSACETILKVAAKHGVGWHFEIDI